MDMSFRNIISLGIIGALCLVAGHNTEGARDKEDEMMELYGLFVDAVEQVEANYVRPVVAQELLESALQGMLQNLDPHSSYINDLGVEAVPEADRGDGSAASASRSGWTRRPTG